MGTRWRDATAKVAHALVVGTGLEASSLLAIPIVPEDTMPAAREICHQPSHSAVGLMCYTPVPEKKNVPVGEIVASLLLGNQPISY